MKKLLPIAALALLMPLSAMADSITPSTFSPSLDAGESITVTKTVTVDAGASTSKVDVVFLADETGSMGGEIANIKAAASTILSNVAGAGDVAFGVAGYRDIYDTYTYKLQSNLTTDQTVAQDAINSWYASGGGDWAEANMFALDEVATGMDWRTGSERIVVWFGDAPGHDPRAGSTEASATAALVSAGVQVEAVNTSGVGSGLDAYGQVERITAATGGTHHTYISSGAISDTILDAINTAISEYTSIGIDTSETPAGVNVSVAPTDYTGTYDRTVARDFTFDVTYTGLTEGTYDFDLYATVDGGRVATEHDHITVGGSAVPEPSAIFLLSLGLFGLGASRRFGKKSS